MADRFNSNEYGYPIYGSHRPRRRRLTDQQSHYWHPDTAPDPHAWQQIARDPDIADVYPGDYNPIVGDPSKHGPWKDDGPSKGTGGSKVPRKPKPSSPATPAKKVLGAK